MKWYHLAHAAWGILIAFGAGYVFFVETPGIDWRIDVVTAICMVPLVVIAVVVYKVMFRKKSPRKSPPVELPASPVDIIQRARDNAR
jgi:amino acid permease